LIFSAKVSMPSAFAESSFSRMAARRAPKREFCSQMAMA
jgi:hypothetical protein